MLLIGQKEIGGGYVRMGFTVAGHRLKAGTPLTAEEINSFANKRRLIDAGFIAVYPPAPVNDAQRYVVRGYQGHYDVIAGTKINDRPLTKAEAEELAGRADH